MPNLDDKDNCVNKALNDLKLKYVGVDYLEDDNQVAVKVKAFKFIPFTFVLNHKDQY